MFHGCSSSFAAGRSGWDFVALAELRIHRMDRTSPVAGEGKWPLCQSVVQHYTPSSDGRNTGIGEGGYSCGVRARPSGHQELGDTPMSDLYTPFAQDLIQELVIAMVIVGAIFFVWKLAKPNG